MRRGYIVARGHGYRITVRYGFDKQTGKYLRHTEQFNGTRPNAEKRCTELIHNIDTGKFIPQSKTTLEKYLNDWLEVYVKPNYAASTYELYKYMAGKHLIPEIGKVGLSDLGIETLQKLYTRKKESGLSSRTTQLIHVTIHKALKQAVKLGMLSINVADNVDKPKIQHREIKPLSNKNVQIVLERAKQTEYYALFYTYLFTGMRRSEVLALRMKDVDLLEMRVSVNRSMVNQKELAFKDPKNESSRRTVPLTPSNAVVLREYIAERNTERAKFKLNPKDDTSLKDDDLIFAHADNTPFRPDTVSHVWMKIVRYCNLTGTRLHDSRHTFATNHLLIGTHPKIVAAMLGHAKTSTTLDMYSHVVPGLMEAAAKSLDKSMLPKLKEDAPKEA